MTGLRRVLVAIPLLITACSPGAGPTPTAPAGATATPGAGAPTATVAGPTAGTTDTPTPVESESAVSPTPEAQASASPGAPVSGDLESLIPTEIAGNEMTIEPASDAANSFMILWNDEQAAQDLLDSIGGSSDDIDVVFSYPSGDTHPNRVYVDGYRVAGADGIALRDGFVENYRRYLAEFTEISVTEETLGGKQVLLLDQPETEAPGQYFYGVGDIVFVVSGTPIEWVEDALTHLP